MEIVCDYQYINNACVVVRGIEISLGNITGVKESGKFKKRFVIRFGIYLNKTKDKFIKTDEISITLDMFKTSKNIRKEALASMDMDAVNKATIKIIVDINKDREVPLSKGRVDTMMRDFQQNAIAKKINELAEIKYNSIFDRMATESCIKIAYELLKEEAFFKT